MLRARVIIGSSDVARRCFSLTTSSSCKPGTAAPTDAVSKRLHRAPDQHDITTMDLIEERIRNRAESREVTFGGQTQRWNYRSEVVGKLGLDKNHTNIWMTYAFIIIFGFGAFIWVKSNVVLSRQEEMQEREKIRRSMKLLGTDRKKVAIVDSD